MRKLATAAISFSAAVFAANYVIDFENILLFAWILAACGLLLVLLHLKWVKRFAIIFLFSSFGLASFYIHSQNTVIKAAEFDGDTYNVEAEILTYPEIYDDYCRLEVRVTSNKLPNLKAYLYDNDKLLTSAEPGDSVRLKAGLSPADTIYGEKYKGYNSKGIYLKLSSQGDVELISGGFDIFALPQNISHWLSSRIEEIFPDDTEVFMRSLMLGDKTDFYGDEELYVSMSRAGLMHIVAVSGMHISFLVSLLYFIFGRGKYGSAICIAVVWLFALVTGFGPSIVRASFMCTTILMAPILRRENDSITSLSTVLAILLFVNPFAASSISLQLSFAAMAGIVLFGGKLYGAAAKKIKSLTKYKIIRAVLFSISSSLSVMSFTVPLTAVHFGTVPLLSPITNLLNMWAVSACFCGGWISCALSVVPFLGKTAAWLCSWLARYIFFTAELISSVPFAVLYANTRGVWLWIGLSYAMFVLFSFVKLSTLMHIVLPGMISLSLVAALMVCNSQYYKGKMTVNFLDVGQGQCATVLTDDVTVVLDCGNIYTIDDAGAIAAAHLYGRGRTAVDYLLLSHLHADHADGAVTLMESIKVHTLLIPSDHDDSDKMYAEIIACAERNGTAVVELSLGKSLDLQGVDITIYTSGKALEENERCLITRLKINNTEVLFLADSTLEMQQLLVEEQDLSEVDILLVSHHGSKYSCNEKLLREVQGETAVISVGQNYYGHPNEETLEALKRYGYNVYRTDIDKNIQITIGN